MQTEQKVYQLPVMMRFVFDHLKKYFMCILPVRQLVFCWYCRKEAFQSRISVLHLLLNELWCDKVELVEAA